MEEMLLHTENIDKAVAEVKAAGGHVLMQLGHNLLVAQVPTHVAKQNSFSHASAHISSSASQKTLTYTNAYWMAREDKLKPQPKVQKWTEETAPMVIDREDSDAVYQGDSPYSPTMTGKIVAAVIAVSGPGSLAFSDDEIQKIISECLEGTKFWAEQAKQNRVSLEFVLHASKVTITTPNKYPNKISCTSYSICHDVFVDPVFKSIGYPVGQEGMDLLARAFKASYSADGAYLVSSLSTRNAISHMPTLVVDLFTCSMATAIRVPMS